MQVNVIIPVHNHIDITMECLGCLEKQTYRDKRIVIIDDGSTDGTYERIIERYPDIEILRGNGNLWWTGAMHMGVDYILKYSQKHDFVLSLNNDTAFDPDFIESLVAVSMKYSRALTGSMEKNYFNRKDILYAGEWLDWQKYIFHVMRDVPVDENADCNEYVNVLPGRGLLIPIEVFRGIGNFDKRRFPHYIADYDFTMRAFNAGFKLILSYKSIIYSRTDISSIAIKDDRPLSCKEAYVNFFSRKSDSNIRDHFNFIRIHCPGQFKKKRLFLLILLAIIRLRALLPVRRLYRFFKYKQWMNTAW